jgi:hypothetical protein
VKRVAEEALGSFTTEEAVKKIASHVGRARGGLAAALTRALGKMAHPSADGALLKALKGSDPMGKTGVIDALGNRKVAAAVEPLAKELKNSSWQVRAAAIYALAKIRTPECVDVLIERLAKEKEGRISQDIQEALYALTGKKIGDNAELWKSWWTVKKSEGLKGPGVEGLKPKKVDPFARLRNLRGVPAAENKGGAVEEESEVPTYYGLKILSKRLVFIIDISGSMEGPLERKPEAQPILTGKGAGGEVPDMSQIKTKLDLAKYELIKAIRGLKKGQQFNVIFYNQDISAWKKGLVPASKGNKAEIIKKIKDLKPDGLTNIYGALEQGFFIWQKVVGDPLDAGNGMVIQNGKLVPAQQEKKSKNSKKDLGEDRTVVHQEYKKGIDSMYFMTDGSPTHGKEQTDDGILGAVKKWNEVRKVKIHTIGIGAHNEKLMRELAAQNRGKYVVP